MPFEPEPTAPMIIAYLQARSVKVWLDGNLSWQPGEEQVTAALETLRLEKKRITSGSVSRPTPEVQRLRSHFRGTSAGEEVTHMTEYVETAEEKAFSALLGKKRGEITEAARELIGIAADCAYDFNL